MGKYLRIGSQTIFLILSVLAFYILGIPLWIYLGIRKGVWK